MIEPLLVTISEATDIIGIGKSKLYEIIAEGKLPIVKLGRRSLIAVDDLKSLVARLKSEAATSVASPASLNSSN